MILYQIDSSKCPKLLPPVAYSNVGDVFSGPLQDGTLVAIKKIRTNYEQAKQVRVYDKSSSICAGLAYLHDLNIIHGNLKGTNVLISQDGTPMLMDFGMASLWDLIPQTSPRPKHSLRWTPPDIYNGKSTYTMSGDIYSLGMTILEAFTSQVPFADLTDDLLVMHVAVSRNIPTRPETIPTNTIDGDRLWAILTKCWSYNPKNRPSAEAVRSEIAPESANNLTPADHPISEEARSEMEPITGENSNPKDHPITEVDRSKMETITVENVDPVDGPSTEAVRDETQATAVVNLDAVDRPTTEEVPSKAETIRPERRKGAFGRLRKWFSRKKKAE
ncbi:unnamed protein product [Rhizoctonia solani]|uniref:Protein kinase domain-containing protein n=2 Tax=Rhizoctonia solani TaxID=456999 RepID=A0A8H3HUQ3_9AGAM|nr:unnamed protein product [Rhizoctonia solani]